MNKKGFTLVELISVVALLGLVAILTTPAYSTVSENIRTRNYNSKKSVIQSQTIEFVNNYMKDIVYTGNTSKNVCFSVRFLIQNGIISSDDEKEEYIENDKIPGKKYQNDELYILVYYDSTIKKMKSIIREDDSETFKENGSTESCTLIYK